MADREVSNEGPQELKRALGGWQIFFILLSVVIGTGVFSFNGAALNIAGPGGFVLAMAVVGIVVICFMDGLTEMIQVFPCTNSIIVYISCFVDHDLAQCCGWAYWLAWCAFTSLQIISAADFAADWLTGEDEIYEYLVRIIAFYVPVPMLLYAINSCDVKLFGRIETVGGAIKLAFSVAVGLILFYLAGKNEGVYLDESCNVVTRPMPDPSHPNQNAYNGTTRLADGFVRSEDFPSIASNFFAAIPIVIFSWTGVEIVAITAFEARRLQDLRKPAQRLPYVLFVLFMIITLGSAMCVSYQSGFIPLFYGVSTERQQSSSIPCDATPFTSTKVLVIVASLQVGGFNMASAINGLMVFLAISAANTCLYTASRVLYGLTFKTQPRQHCIRRLFSWLGHLNSAQVPRRAVLISVLLFSWYPFLVFISTRPNDPTNQDNQEFAIILPELLSTLGSFVIVLVWGTHCLAFIRYYYWLRKHKKELIEKRYPELNRWARWEGPEGRTTSTLLRTFQPGIAYLGFLSCFLIVFVLPSALMWKGRLQTKLGEKFAYEVVRLYLVQVIFLLAWLSLKVVQWYDRGSFRNIEWFVRLEDDPKKLDNVFRHLQLLSEEPIKASDRV